MAIKIPSNADIKSIEFELKRSDTGKFVDELDKSGYVELGGDTYAVNRVDLEQQPPVERSKFEVYQEPKVKISIELYKLKGENNE